MKDPQKKLNKLLAAALDVAAWPPAERSDSGASAKMPWYMIETLRARFEEFDISWKAHQQNCRYDERRAARDWKLPEEREE